MAVVQNPLIGKARDSIGGVTFTKWKGLNILKTRAHPHNPRTTRQQAHRVNFKLAVETFRRLLDSNNIGFAQYARTNKTTSNGAVHFNCAVTGKFLSDNLTPPFTPITNFPAGVVAKGPIDNVLSPAVASTLAAGFTVTWTDNSNGTTAKSNDHIGIVLINTVTTTLSGVTYYDSIFWAQAGDLRSTGVSTKSLPIIWGGRTVAVYIYCIRDGVSLVNPLESSNSQYVATVTIT